MNAPRKRRWFQLHASTLVIVAVFWGVFLLWQLNRADAPLEQFANPMNARRPTWFDKWWAQCPLGFMEPKLFLLGVVLLFAIALLCEWRIRRRVAK